jgi:hypothetical protein
MPYPVISFPIAFQLYRITLSSPDLPLVPRAHDWLASGDVTDPQPLPRRPVRL